MDTGRKGNPSTDHAYIYFVPCLRLVSVCVLHACNMYVASATCRVIYTCIVNVCNNTLLHAFIFVGRNIYLRDLFECHIYIYIFEIRIYDLNHL